HAMGADHLSFGPPLGPDPVDAIGLLGERVLPALRALGRAGSAPASAAAVPGAAVPVGTVPGDTVPGVAVPGRGDGR
ncbi:MAG TPA: hypothetical protein VGM12_06180, partial [Trebonia sp.]